MWTIYSTGDANFLEQIFISIAMVVGSGSFAQGAAISMLIGFLLVLFQGIIKGAREFNIGAVFIAWILFMLMFIPTTTVIIEDRVNGNDRVVSNVPVGVGAAGSIISSIGYGLTELFEQGYTYIGNGVTDKSFAESLNVLNKIRSHKNNPMLFGALNDDLAPGADIRKSWDNYIRECTLRQIDLGQTSADTLMKTPLPAALRFDSTIYMTELVLNNNPQVMNCSQAYNELSVMTSSAMQSSEFQAQLAKVLMPEAASNPYSVSGQAKVNDALQNLGLSTTYAQQYVEASILMPIYEQAVIGKYKDSQDFTSAITINQAIAQRNTQWTMEQSMFMNLVRPLQTFFEGFVYGITPILAMLIVTGSFGFSMAGKYLQLLFWIQLWLPILSIVNLYISSAASGEMGAYDNASLNSMYSLNGINDVVQNWVSVGGMLASSVPMIALFVVTGSTYAFTSIAGRLNGADHVNEKINSPDVVQPAPLMKQDAMTGNNPYKGTSKVGMEDMVSNVSVGNALRQATASSEQKAIESGNQFAKSLSNAVSKGGSSFSSSAVSGGLTKAFESTTGHQRESLENFASKIQKSYGVDRQTAVQMASAYQAGMTGSWGGGGSGGESGGGRSAASGGANATETTTQTKAVKLSDLSQLAQDSGVSNKDTMGFQGKVASNIDFSNQSGFRSEMGEKAAKEFKQSATDVEKNSKAYSKSQELSNNLGANASTRMDTVAATINDGATPEAAAAGKTLNDYYTMGLATDQQKAFVDKRARTLEHAGGMSPGTALTTARLEGLMLNGTSNAESINTGAGIINSAMGQGDVPQINPEQNAGLQAPGFGHAKSEAQNATRPADGLALGSVPSYVAGSQGNAPAQFANHPIAGNFTSNTGTVVQDYNGNADRMDQTEAGQRKEASEIEKDNFLKQKIAAANDSSGSLSDFFGSTERVLNHATGQISHDSVKAEAMQNYQLTEAQADYFASRYMAASGFTTMGKATGLIDDNNDGYKAALEAESGKYAPQITSILNEGAKKIASNAKASLDGFGDFNTAEERNQMPVRETPPAVATAMALSAGRPNGN